MANIIDLKKLGIIQDVRELKGKRKEKAIRLKIIPKPKPKPSYKIPTSLASAQDIVKSVERDERIKKEKSDRVYKQVKEVGRFGAATVKRVEKLAERKLRKRAISRRVLKQTPRVTVDLKTNRPVPNSLSEPNIYFKSEYQKEKENLFFKW